MGFLPDIKRILAALPPRRQNLLFSATFPEEVRRLAKQLLHAPVNVEVARRNAPADLVSHEVHLVPALRKRALLAHLIRSRDMRQVLVFVRMKRDANRLARQLQQDGVAATAIHSDRTQQERTQALEEFKQGKVTALVATDIAARGLDIEELPFVVNYELPYTPEDYVHRIGRTGRAGLPGDAISLVSPDEMKLLEGIERLLKRALPRAAAAAGLEVEARRAPASAAGTRRPHPKDAPRERAPHAKSAPVGFDFSKPYEPSPSSSPPQREPAHPSRRGPARPTAALLGGHGKREPKK